MKTQQAPARLPARLTQPPQPARSTQPAQSNQAPTVRAKRFPLHWPLRAGHRTHGSVAGRTLDVSASGLLFQTSAEYAVGELIEMEVALDFKYLARVLVQITRSVGYDRGLNSYGARFTGGECPGLEMIRDKLLALNRADQTRYPQATNANSDIQHPAVNIVEPIPQESRLARLFNDI